MEQTHTPAFRPAYMSKTTLALCYFPAARPCIARQRLSRWINGCPELLNSLFACGYHKRQRMLTPLQVSLIVKYLDSP